MVIVNFGCGATARQGCQNIDGSLTVLLAKLPLPNKAFGPRAEFVAAIRDYKIKFGTARRIRFENASLDAFYTSHTLEHLTRNDCENLLRRVRDWLKPSGALRVVLPDLKQLARDYISGKLDADGFVAGTHLANQRSQWGPFVIGHGVHRWMYDCESFIAFLERLGYRECQRSNFGMSRLAELGALDVEARRSGSFYVEAIK